MTKSELKLIKFIVNPEIYLYHLSKLESNKESISITHKSTLSSTKQHAAALDYLVSLVGNLFNQFT